MVHGRIQKFSTLREENFPHMMQCSTGLLHGISDGHRLEVAAMMNFSGFAVDERVIGR